MTTQGQSSYTKSKEASLARILAQHMNICAQILSRPWADPVYRHWDIYAGCGQNEEAGCEGSPLVFLSAIRRAGLGYDAAFIEQDEGSAGKLKEALRDALTENDRGKATVYQDDNATRLPVLLREIRKEWTFGLIYADPNGYPPFDLLAEASRAPRCQRIDILIYASATTVKRVRGAFGAESLGEKLAKIDKKVWLIQKPRGHAQWTFLLGTNYDRYNGYRAIDLYRLDSDMGQEIWQRLDKTRAELEEENRQPAFFDYKTYDEYRQLPEFRAVRAQVMERAGGVCERCKQRPATEPHHLVYPEWGTIDVPENMIAVCHQCHCALHGKDN